MLGHTSVAAVLGEAAHLLSAAGVADPRREATELWAALTGTTPGDVWLAWEGAASPDRKRALRRAVRRRAGGEPRAYVVGHAGFRTLDLRVDRRVLIPRPETEGLVERVLAWARTRAAAPDESWGRAADVGTGSGCIALSLAVEGRFSGIVATDSSTGALEVARENVARTAPRVPVELRHGYLCDPLRGETFDVIVSNPPYVTAQEHASLEDAVRRFEPLSALVGGTDGLEHTRRLLETCPSCLAPGGLLTLEVDCTRAEKAMILAYEAGWNDVHVESDLCGRPRYLLAMRETTL